MEWGSGRYLGKILGLKGENAKGPRKRKCIRFLTRNLGRDENQDAIQKSAGGGLMLEPTSTENPGLRKEV